MTFRYPLLASSALFIAALRPATASADAPGAAQATFPVSQTTPPVSPGDLQRTLICATKEGSKASELPTAGADEPRFTLHATGDLDLTSESSSLSFSFDEFKGDAIARIETVGQATPQVWCSPVSTKLTYKIAAPPVEGTMLRVQLFVGASTPSPQLIAERAAVLAAAQLAERKALHSGRELRAFADKVAALPPRNADPDGAIQAGNDLTNALKALKDEWKCPEGTAPLGPAVCDEIRRLSITVQRLARLVTLLHGPSKPQLSDELDRQYHEEARALVAALNVEPREITDDARNQQCHTLAKLRWLNSDEMFRLAARAQVPVVPPSRLALVRYQGVKSRSGASMVERWGMAVTHVPVGTKLFFDSHLGTALSIDPAVALSAVLLRATGNLPASVTETLKALSDDRSKLTQQLTELDAQLAELDAQLAEPDTHSLLCNVEDLRHPPPQETDRTAYLARLHERLVSVQSHLMIDPDLAPTAAVETLSYVFEPFDGKKVVDLVACGAESCKLPDDIKNVRGRATLTPDRTGSWTLFAEATVGMGLYGGKDLAFWNQNPFAIQNAPRFEAVDRGDGPDQLFEMNVHGNPRNAISTSVIVGRYVRDRWLLGIGPVLTVGGTSGAFSQWNARLAYRLTDSGTYLTFGPSVRFLAEPVDFALHDRVSVAKPMGGAASAPAFRTTYGAEWQFDIGFGIDIGTLGAAMADTLKSFGGGK
jgi:hypothetical protein